MHGDDLDAGNRQRRTRVRVADAAGAEDADPSRYVSGLNLDVAEPDLVAVVLERMWPFCGLPKRAMSLNLLLAIAAFSAGESSSYCSTLLAVQPVLDVVALDDDSRACSTRRPA